MGAGSPPISLDPRAANPMTDAAHILVVDDDARIRRLVSRYLLKEGFRVSTAADGEEMQRVLDEGGVEVVLLDLILPGEDGLSLARKLRAQSNVGIIMLTGKGEIVDRVVGLELGADDYVAKPFDNRELLARIRSLLRRLREVPRPPEAGQTARFSGWVLDLDSRELRTEEGREVRLTTAEFKLLATFVTNATLVLTRDQLLDHIADREWAPFDRSIDVLVGKLRRKIDTDPSKSSLIASVRGVGYKFTADVEMR